MERAAAAAARSGHRGEVELFTSAVLLDELAHTLGYSKFAARIEAFGTSIAALVAQ